MLITQNFTSYQSPNWEEKSPNWEEKIYFYAQYNIVKKNKKYQSYRENDDFSPVGPRAPHDEFICIILLVRDKE